MDLSWRAMRGRLSQAGERLVERVRPAREWWRRGSEHVSALGWMTMAGASIALVVGWVLGWQEFRVIGAGLLALLALSSVFLLGRTVVAVSLDLDPERLVVGASAAGRLQVTNIARSPLLSLALEVPVGESSVRFVLPVLAPQGQFEDVLVIPTYRRGVIQVGPVRTQRGDPFGLVRREVAWTGVQELFVHPRTVPLGTLGAGFLRDLEGRTTQDISKSDLAFHTLREYEPGDDRRSIHWRSSAKASGAGGAPSFLVRQFLDTRRSHIAVIVDVDQASYAAPAEFETALSCGASVTIQALSDAMDTTIICGRHVAVRPVPFVALDTYSRAEAEEFTLPQATGGLAQLVPEVSSVLLITGALATFETLQRAALNLDASVRIVAVQVAPGADPSYRHASGMTIITLPRLEDLPRVLAAGVVA